MRLTAAEMAALLPVLMPALGACLLPIASLDKDQATAKWIRGAMFGVAVLALMGSFLFETRLWSTGLQPSFGPLHMDRMGQFAGIFVVVAALMAVMQLWDHLHQEGWVKGETLSLLLFSVTGMLLFASTTNLPLIFLGLELLSLPLYALTATHRFRLQSPEGAMKYFLTGAVASACFLMGSVLLYGLSGSMDLKEMSRIFATNPDPLALSGAALLLVGFLFKTSAVPFHQWTPDAYEAAPHPIAGFMSVATKGVAIIALIRIFPGALSLGMSPLGTKFRMALAFLAVLTLILANLSALVQVDLKRLLAYSSISHAGYLLLGLVAGTPMAYTGMLFYLVAYLAMNMGAFGLLSALGMVGERTRLEDLRGIGWKRPGIGVATALCLMSLAGIPPTGGFYGKFMIFKELIQQGHVSLAVLGVLASLVSVYYYLRILTMLFAERPKASAEREAAERPAVEAPYAGATVLVCGLISLVVGLLPGLMVDGFVGVVLRDALPLMR